MNDYDEEIPVLIIGGGYAGLASAMFLSHYGVPCLLADRHGGYSPQGRARGINPRTLELYRPLGIEAAVYQAGSPFDGDSGGVFCERLTGEWTWIFGDPRQAGTVDADPFTAHSPARFCLADQNAIEPILIKAARERGADLRFETELIDFRAYDDGVIAAIRDRVTGTERRIRADYLIGADGNRSLVREQLGIGRDGSGTSANFVSIMFRADLSEVVWHPAILWIIGNAEAGGAIARAAEPTRWGATVPFDPATESLADYPAERCAAIVTALIGRDLPLEIEDVATWSHGVAVAKAYRSGPVFLAGDSAHVWSPAGGLGANSGIQDAQNLAWKLAGVHHGWAGQGLLDSYEAERRPVAEALAVLTEERQGHRKGGTPEQDRQQDALWVFGQRYRSAAIDGPDFPTVYDTAPDWHGQPGLRAPHAWLETDDGRVSVHDLVDRTFLLLTDSGPAGEAWRDAVAELATVTGAPLTCRLIGTDLQDPDGDFATHYNLAPGEAVLLRPDGYVAWRGTERAILTTTFPALLT